MSAPLAGIQTALFMWIIAAFGYNQHAEVQSASAEFGIRFATAGVPIILTLVGAVALAFLPYTKAVEAELSRFSEQQREGGLANPELREDHNPEA